MKTEQIHHETIAAQLTTCSERLQDLRDTVFRRQWDKVGARVSAYEDEISRLAAYGDKHPTDSEFLESFEHLAYQQRRVMRSIHEAMQSTSEDIESMTQGIRRIQKLAKFVGSGEPKSEAL